jgi:hypothetical protein
MEWGEAIIDAIEQCRIMVLVFTANANASPQIRREIERAVNRGVAILPLRMEDVLPGKALEYFIGNVHWLDALTQPFEAHLKNLAGTIRIVLARMEPSDAPTMQPVVAREAPVVAKPREATTARPAEPAFAPSAEFVAVLPEVIRPAEISPAAAATEDAVIPVPAKISSSTNSDSGESNTRRIGERRPMFAAAASASPRKIPAWAWGGATVLVLLIVVFAAALFTAHPAPVASHEPVAPTPQSVPGTAVPSRAEPVAPAASPQTASDDGATLQETMRTLQDELSSIGKAKYTAFTQNKIDGSSFQSAFVNQVSKVAAYPALCIVSFHWRSSRNGAALLNMDSGLPLHDLTSLVVEPMSQYQTEVSSAAGNPNLVVTSTTPPVMVLLVRGSRGGNPFPFTDATLANRTAATLRQAVKLCGGTLTN